MTTPDTNHEEALQLAALKQHESNLARCYLGLVTQHNHESAVNAEEVKRLNKLVSGYYGEAQEGWTKFREAERQLAKAQVEIARLRNALSEIQTHSVCCDARHTASKVL